MPTISNLSSLTSITGTLIFPVVDLTSPIPNKRATLQQLKYWIEGSATVASVAGRIGDIILTYQDIGGLSTLAHTGNYSDIIGKPATFSVTTATASVLGGVIIGKNINVTTSGTISINTATGSDIGLVKIGTGISVTADGTISTTPISSSTVAYGLSVNSGILSVNTASTSTFGGVIVGNGLNVNNLGTINVNTATTTTAGTVVVGDGLYLNNIATVNLTTASSTALGGIKAGFGVSITDDGVMTVTTGNFALAVATSSILGGVKIGDNINVAGDGTISLDGQFKNTILSLNSAQTTGTSITNSGTGTFYQVSGIGVNRGTGTSAILLYTDNYYINTGSTAPWGGVGTTGTSRGIWIVGQTDDTSIFGTNGLMVDYIRVSSTATELNIFGYNNSNTAVISVRGTTNYETRVTQDYHIPNKKYVDVKSTSTATTSALGAVKLGFGILATGDGTISIASATTAVYGLVKVGTGLSTDGPGVVSLNTATTSTIGGVRSGWPNNFGINIDRSSSTSTGIIALVTATTTAIGGIKVGTGLNMNTSGALDLIVATSSVLGGVTAGANMDVTVGGALTFAGGIVSKSVYFSNATAATSTSTGTLVVQGGVGISGDLYIGGNITASKLTIEYTTITTALIKTDDVISTYNTTQSTSTSSGALQVSGGVGIGGTVNIGGNLFTTGTIYQGVWSVSTTTLNTSTLLVALASTAITSTQIQTVVQTTNASYYPTFVDANNTTTTSESLYTTSSFTINPNTGNVGIGVTSGTTKLDVFSSVANSSTGVLKLYGANGTERYTGIDFHGITSETYNKMAQITVLVSNGGNGTGAVIGGDIIFRTNNSASNVPTEKMRIDANGNVGIGTISPGAKLEVKGGATDNATININNNNSNIWKLWNDNGANGLNIQYNGTTKLSVSSGTNVTINGSLTVTGTNTQIGNFYSSFGIAAVNFSNTPVYTTSTTISDARAVVGATIIVTPSATTGTNILGGDELEMDNFTVAASVTTNGIINLYVTALPGPVKGQRNFNYILG